MAFNKNLPSVMTHDFSRVAVPKIPRSHFDRSHGHKTTFDSGYLIPLLVDEVLPGDTFTFSGTYLARLTTPITPFMDNLRFETFAFFVPNRLIWENWERFNGQQDNPGDSTDFLTPVMSPPTGGYTSQSLSDYMGIPTFVDGFSHVSLWHRAYNLIWNEWFRDENLQDSVPVPKDDGPDDPADFVLLRRGKRHDYFTSSLPWPQKGPAVILPLGGSAPLIGDVTNTVSSSGTFSLNNANFQLPGSSSSWNSSGPSFTGPGQYTSGLSVSSDISGVSADLAEATSITVNALRQSVQIQKLFEKDARGGTRYTEKIRAHFRVISPDARLQRPEYLGGSSHVIYVNAVQQTSSSDSSSPQGNLAAYSVSADRLNGFTQSFTEHGVLIVLGNVRADITYQQGLARMFSRRTLYDFYWPTLSHLGEQEVLNKEIYLQGNDEDDEAFGYQERYAEYRYKPSIITGKMRSADPQSLDIWHLSQYFANKPVLNSEFIEDNPPIDRVVAVQDEPQFRFDGFFKFSCARPMPVYSIPGLMDHF